MVSLRSFTYDGPLLTPLTYAPQAGASGTRALRDRNEGRSGVSVPAGPVPVPRRKAGKEMGRDVTRKRREKRSDDKSDETRPITVTFLVPHASLILHLLVWSVSPA